MSRFSLLQALCVIALVAGSTQAAPSSQPLKVNSITIAANPKLQASTTRTKAPTPTSTKPSTTSKRPASSSAPLVVPSITIGPGPDDDEDGCWDDSDDSSSASATPTSKSSPASSTSSPASSTASSAKPSASSAPDFWIGGNSYYLHAFNTKARLQVLDAMQSVGMKTVRIFIASIYAGAKGADNVAVPDVEPDSPGSYDDAILEKIDQLMVECKERNMKLIISIGDRYALGFWSTDAYALKFGLVKSGTSGAQQVANAENFYTDSDAISYFDKRIKHVMAHKNKLLGNKPWSQLDNVIYALEPQNEPMGHMDLASTTWNCDRAATIKSQLPSGSGILISTGGGITIQTSLADWAFSCKNFDIVSVHDYGTDVPNSVAALVAGQTKAAQSGKQVVFEEWGASGASKAAIIGDFVPALQAAGIPNLIWEVVQPGAGAKDFEIWTDEDSWQVFQDNASNLGYSLTKRSIDYPAGFQRVHRHHRRAPSYRRSPPVPARQRAPAYHASRVVQVQAPKHHRRMHLDARMRKLA